MLQEVWSMDGLVDYRMGDFGILVEVGVRSFYILHSFL